MKLKSTFMGIPFTQEWADLPIWETFFDDHPIKTFVELGSGVGGMSLFLALQCYQRRIIFHTFDNQKFMNFDDGLSGLLKLSNVFHFVDLFSGDGQGQVMEIIQTFPAPIAMFFDDGDKPREWRLMAPLLNPGDFCIVHDWGTEFMPEDIGDVKVERILGDLCDIRPPGYKSMWFRRI